MPVHFDVYEGENDPIVFPLTLNDDPFDLTGITHLVLVKSGWNGKLTASLHSGGAALAIEDQLQGQVRWAVGSGDLRHSQSPYRVYFRAFTSGLTTYLTVPRGDHFLIHVHDDLI